MRKTPDILPDAFERRAKKWNPVFRSPGATNRKMRASEVTLGYRWDSYFLWSETVLSHGLIRRKHDV